MAPGDQSVKRIAAVVTTYYTNSREHMVACLCIRSHLGRGGDESQNAYRKKQTEAVDLLACIHARKCFA